VENTITPASVKARVKAIDRIKADDEAAHSDEDILHQDVLQAIADGAAHPADLARAALETKKLDFQRWCA
jgi:hypothetical protein